MTNPGPIPRPNDQPWQEIQRIWEALRERDRRTLYSATISDGQLIVQDGAEIGIRHDTTGAWLLRAVRTGSTYTLTIGDRNGHTIVCEDATSGNGLGRPWLPIPTVNLLGLPMTASATFVVASSTGSIKIQQPHVEAQSYLQSTGGAVGQARYVLNGSPVGTTMTIAAGSAAWAAKQTVPLGTYDQSAELQLQVRVTNATGTVGGAMIATQRQSP